MRVPKRDTGAAPCLTRCGCGRFLKRWRPKQWSVVGNVGPLLLMVMFCGVVYGYGTHGGLRKHGTCVLLLGARVC